MRSTSVLRKRTSNRLLLRRAAFGVAIATFAAISPSLFGQGQPVVYTHDISIDNLPSNLQMRFAPGTSAAAVENVLAHQPTLVLDGVTLRLTPPKNGDSYSRSIAVKRLELRHQSKIVTDGWDIEIHAESFVSDGGEIISFESSEMKNAAEPGTSGRSGRGGGNVVLDSKLDDDDRLRVILIGQDGQAGGVGSPGAPGAMGAKGEDASWGVFGCNHGGGGGLPGSAGGPGGSGGNGGAGGNGGHLVLRGGITAQRIQIQFSAPGGKGGIAGEGGSGGPGGEGGLGGNGGGPCGGGPRGTPGSVGARGNKGADGIPGAAGRISVQ